MSPRLILFALAVAMTTSVVLADKNAHIFFQVIRHLQQKDPSWQSSNPLINWNGVTNCPGAECTFSTANATANLGYRGVIDFGALPPTFNFFKRLIFSACNCSGQVDMANLPTELRHLDLSFNIENPPRAPFVYNQGFSGPLDLSRAPATLEYLCVPENNFSSVDMSTLPPRLVYLNIGHNLSPLTGAIPWSALPASLESFAIGRNGFQGTVDWAEVSRLTNLTYFDVRANSFTGTVDLTSLPAGLQQLTANENAFSGYIELGALPATLWWLELSLNQFTGTVDATRLPAAMNNSECTVDVDNTGVYAVFTTPATFQYAPYAVSPMLQINTSLPATPVPVGVYSSPSTKLALHMSASGTATLGNCQVTIPAGVFLYAADTGFVGGSGVVAAVLDPCLPASAADGTAEYLVVPAPNTLVFVTNGTQNVTFVRAKGN